MRWSSAIVWKALGIAGVAGVAATGAVIARDHRQRAALAPDEVRERLRARAAEHAHDSAAPPSGSAVDAAGSTASRDRA